jgi:hypothetical protein
MALVPMGGSLWGTCTSCRARCTLVRSMNSLWTFGTCHAPMIVIFLHVVPRMHLGIMRLRAYFSSFFNKPITTSTTLRKPSISSSTVPPIPALAKLVEFPTYTGFRVLRARTFDRRVVKSRVPPCVKRGVLSVSAGVTLWVCVSDTSSHHVHDALTFGMAYTKEPNGAEDADSGVAVVRKSSRFGPLSVS